MAAGKRKAEGIALLSLYYDEDDEEVEEGEEVDAKEESKQEQEIGPNDSKEGEAHMETTSEIFSMYRSFTTVETSINISKTLTSMLPVHSSQEEDDLIHSPVAGNGAHGFIVDYAHDEGALSPDAEEGEIMTTGRAVLALGAQVSNGIFQEATPPSLVRQEDSQREDQDPQFNLSATELSAATVSQTTDCLDQEEIEATVLDEGASDTDSLADFLPPPPTTKCSQELQKKFAKFLAYKNDGRSFNEELRKSKGYRNPDFLQRAVQHQEIDQIGSCFGKEVFDPHGYDASDFFDALALEFRREQERKEQAKKQSQRIDFAHGVQAAPASTLSDKAKPVLIEQRDQPPLGSRGLTTGSEAVPKSDSARSSKKSKWDKVDPDTDIPPFVQNVTKSAIVAVSAAHSALLTANAGGGYASFALQKRKEAEERLKGKDKRDQIHNHDFMTNLTTL